MMNKRCLPPICGLCGKDLTAQCAANPRIVLNRDAVENMETILSSVSGNNNVAVTGPAGAGKTTMVEALASEVGAGKCPRLAGRRIVSIKIDRLLSGIYNVSDIGKRFEILFSEAKEGKIILFIDEGHRICNSGANSCSNIIKPYLTDPDIQMIIATTTAEYNMYIAPDQAFKRRFEPVRIEPADDETTAGILRKSAAADAVKVSDTVLRKMVELGNVYLADRANPEKALSVFNYAVSWLRKNNAPEAELTLDSLYRSFSLHYGISSGALAARIPELLRGLQKRMADAFPGWEEGTAALQKKLSGLALRDADDKRHRGFIVLKGPDGNLLLALAKTAAEAMGYGKDIVEIDPDTPDSMSFSARTGARKEILFDTVRENPHKAVIVKGMSECHKSLPIHTRLRRIAESSKLVNEIGEMASFTHALVFITCEDECSARRRIGIAQSERSDVPAVAENALFPGTATVEFGAPCEGKVAEVVNVIFMERLRGLLSSSGMDVSPALSQEAGDELMAEAASPMAYSKLRDAAMAIATEYAAKGNDGRIEFRGGSFEVAGSETQEEEKTC